MDQNPAKQSRKHYKKDVSEPKSYNQEDNGTESYQPLTNKHKVWHPSKQNLVTDPIYAKNEHRKGDGFHKNKAPLTRKKFNNDQYQNEGKSNNKGPKRRMNAG